MASEAGRDPLALELEREAGRPRDPLAVELEAEAKSAVRGLLEPARPEEMAFPVERPGGPPTKMGEPLGPAMSRISRVLETGPRIAGGIVRTAAAGVLAPARPIESSEMLARPFLSQRFAEVAEELAPSGLKRPARIAGEVAEFTPLGDPMLFMGGAGLRATEKAIPAALSAAAKLPIVGERLLPAVTKFAPIYRGTKTAEEAEKIISGYRAITPTFRQEAERLVAEVEKTVPKVPGNEWETVYEAAGQADPRIKEVILSRLSPQGQKGVALLDAYAQKTGESGKALWGMHTREGYVPLQMEHGILKRQKGGPAELYLGRSEFGPPRDDPRQLATALNEEMRVVRSRVSAPDMTTPVELNSYIKANPETKVVKRLRAKYDLEPGQGFYEENPFRIILGRYTRGLAESTRAQWVADNLSPHAIAEELPGFRKPRNELAQRVLGAKAYLPEGLADFVDKVTIKEPMSEFKQYMNRVQQLWGQSVTVASGVPYHASNFATSVLQLSGLYGPWALADPRIIRDAIGIYRGAPGYELISQTAKAAGAIGGGQLPGRTMGAVFGRVARITERMAEPGVRQALGRTIEKPFSFGSKLAEDVDGFSRSMAIALEMRANRGDVAKAITRANKIIVSSADLPEWVDVLRRVDPFIGWHIGNLKLQAELLPAAPGAVAFPVKVRNLIEAYLGAPERPRTKAEERELAVRTGIKMPMGREVSVGLRRASPLSSLELAAGPALAAARGGPGLGIRELGKQTMRRLSPFVAAPVSALTGIDPRTGEPFELESGAPKWVQAATAADKMHRQLGLEPGKISFFGTLGVKDPKAPGGVRVLQHAAPRGLWSGIPMFGATAQPETPMDWTRYLGLTPMVVDPRLEQAMGARAKLRRLEDIRRTALRTRSPEAVREGIEAPLLR